MHFYRFGSVRTTERLGWLEPIIRQHTIYLPSCAELNDPREGRPRLAKIPAQAIVDFLYMKYEERTPFATPTQRARALNDIRQIAAFDGRDALLSQLTTHLHR